MIKNTFQNLKCKLCCVLFACVITSSSFAKNPTTDKKSGISKTKFTPFSLATFSKRKANFNIIVQSNQTILTWSVIDVRGGKYLIYRSEGKQNFSKIGEKLILADASEPSLYIFHDVEPAKGLNCYKLLREEPNGELKEIASKQVYLDAKYPANWSKFLAPSINRI